MFYDKQRLHYCTNTCRKKYNNQHQKTYKNYKDKLRHRRCLNKLKNLSEAEQFQAKKLQLWLQENETIIKSSQVAQQIYVSRTESKNFY
jgi:hypothetical protein